MSADVSRFQYLSLIQHVAFLQAEFLGRSASQDFVKKGGDIHYVYDSSVIAANVTPHYSGRLFEGRFGFGQLYPRRYQFSPSTDEKTRKIHRVARQREDINAGAVAAALTGFALDLNQNDDPNPPLLQLKEHYDETMSYKENLNKQVESRSPEKLEKRRKHSKKIIDRVVKAIREGKLKHLQPEQVISALLKTISRLEEMSNLGSEAAYLRLEDTLKRNIGGGECLWEKAHDYLKIGDSFDTGIYKNAAAVLFELFSEVLKQRAVHGVRLQSDIQSLVELTLLNKYYHHLSHSEKSDEKGTRVVMVTCDNKLVRACYRAPQLLKLRLKAYVEKRFSHISQGGKSRVLVDLELFFGFDGGQKKEERWFNKFSHHYVRSHFAFARDVVSDKGHSDRFEQIFDGLFAKNASIKKQSRWDLEEIANDPRKMGKVPSGFEALFIESLERSNQLVEDGFGTEIKKRLEINANDVVDLSSYLADGIAKTNFAAFEKAFTELLDRTRDRCVLAYSKHGTQLVHEAGKQSLRTPPDLYFLTLKKSCENFDKLSTEQNYPGGEEWLDIFESIKTYDCAETDDDRWEVHLKFLNLAASFACVEKWSTARSHVYRAIDILERGKSEGIVILALPKTKTGSNPSGREAYFLLSFCERMLAEDADDLKRASAALTKSVEAHTDDCNDRNNGMRIDGGYDEKHPLSMLRYENEKLSIALGHYYVERRNVYPAAVNVNAIWEECGKEDAYESALPCLTTIRKAFDIVREHSDFIFGNSSITGNAMHITNMTTATNIVQLSVIGGYWKLHGKTKVFPELTQEHLQNAVNYIQRNESEKGTARHIFNSLTDVYLHVAKAMVDYGDSQSFNDEGIFGDGGFEKFFGQHQSREASKIDVWRYKSLKEFVAKLKDSSHSET